MPPDKKTEKYEKFAKNFLFCNIEEFFHLIKQHIESHTVRTLCW